MTGAMTGRSPLHTRNWGTHQISRCWKVMMPGCSPDTQTLGLFIYMPCLLLPALGTGAPPLYVNILGWVPCPGGGGRSLFHLLLWLSAALQGLTHRLRWTCFRGVSSGCADGLHYLIGRWFLLHQILVIPNCMLPFWSYVAAKLNLWLKHGYCRDIYLESSVSFAWIYWASTTLYLPGIYWESIIMAGFDLRQQGVKMIKCGSCSLTV